MSIHDLPTADALRRAALESITRAPDPQTGERADDPLRVLIPEPYSTTAEILALVKIITGRTIARGSFIFSAPAARSALRRWAEKEASA